MRHPRPHGMPVLARFLLLAIIGGLIAGAGSGSAVAAAAPTLLTGKIGQADYRIQVPPMWNGTLVLYSHGYVAPGQDNPALEASDPVTGAALLAQGYALVGTSYSTTGWALEQAFTDQVAVLDRFAQQVGTPKRTIAWGDSLGGIITAGLVQRNPTRFAGALPMCGVVQGSVATWNGALDAEFAFKHLLDPQDPALQLVNIADPQANATRALGLLRTAQGTPQGRARLALAAAFNQTPDWYDPTAPRPTVGDYATRQANQAAWLANPQFPFGFAFRAELEARAGGNPSFNTGVSYRELFARSNERDLATALYREVDLDLDAALAALDAAPRIAADPQALDYLRRNIVFDGTLAIPVLTMHTVADGLVAPEGAAAYRDVVNAAGSGDFLRQTFVNRAGHCAFTPAERLAAFGALVKRIDTGTWDDAALTPAALNATATALGPDANVLLQANGRATTAGFTADYPTPLLRPFDARSAAPAPAPSPGPIPAPSSSPVPGPSPTPRPTPTPLPPPGPAPSPPPLPRMPNTGGGGGARSPWETLAFGALGLGACGIAGWRLRRRRAA